MEVQILRKSKFFCLAMALLIALGIFVSAGTSVYASEVSVDDNAFTEALENSFMYDAAEDLFYVDREIALNSGLTEENIKNIEEFIFYLENNSESKEEFKKELGLDSIIQSESDGVTMRALPLFVIAALKLAGKAIAGAIIATVAKHGIATACKKFKGNVKVFDNYCKSNGWG